MKALLSSTIEAAKAIGKNCLVMKVLSPKSINIEALRKNLRTIWKPSKSVQINEVEDEIYLVEFGDGSDKRRIMEMSPWTYEKSLVLLKEFKGKQVPKDISLWQSPFWVQIHNLLLKHRTREMRWAIGTKLGEVMDVDVLKLSVNWGNFLWIRMLVDVKKKLVRGKRNVIENGGQRWITFKYERLPNFCYKCGLLSHGVKDCKNRNGSDANMELNNLQYRAWLRGETLRKSGGEFTRFGLEEERFSKGGLMRKLEGGHAIERIDGREEGNVPESTAPIT